MAYRVAGAFVGGLSLALGDTERGVDIEALENELRCDIPLQVVACIPCRTLQSEYEKRFMAPGCTRDQHPTAMLNGERVLGGRKGAPRWEEAC